MSRDDGYRAALWRRGKFFVILGMSMLVLSCSGGGIYKPLSEGVGYQETKIAENRYRVQMAGDSQSSWEQVQDALLLRAAELALDNGQKAFRVESAESERQTARYRLLDNQHHHHSYGTHGAVATLSGATEIQKEAREVDRIVSTAVVQLLPRVPEGNDDVAIYDVEAVINDLRPVLLTDSVPAQ